MIKVFALIFLSVIGLLPTNVVQAASERGESDFAQRRDRLVEKYPGLLDKNLKSENTAILCPFLRMLTRAGIVDENGETDSEVLVSIIKIASKAREFGCSVIGCGGVATAVSAGQLTQGATDVGKVNLTALHEAVGIAHECGLGFAFGGTTTDATVIAQTLDQLSMRADELGRITFEDLENVKLQRCEEQGVEISTPGATEIKLIFGFLGGNTRGFIEVSDVRRFFTGKLPLTIGNPI